MDANTPLWKAHDISQQLQDKIEVLPNVNRAFVHVDHETTHMPVSSRFVSLMFWLCYFFHFLVWLRFFGLRGFVMLFVSYVSFLFRSVWSLSCLECVERVSGCADDWICFSLTGTPKVSVIPILWVDE